MKFYNVDKFIIFKIVWWEIYGKEFFKRVEDDWGFFMKLELENRVNFYREEWVVVYFYFVILGERVLFIIIGFILFKLKI